MRVYDLVLVIRAGIGEEESKKLLETTQKWLASAKVEVRELGKKILAYPIKKEREGLYFLLNINYSDESGVPTDFEKKLLMNETVLRHLLIRRRFSKNGSQKP